MTASVPMPDAGFVKGGSHAYDKRPSYKRLASTTLGPESVKRTAVESDVEDQYETDYDHASGVHVGGGHHHQTQNQNQPGMGPRKRSNSSPTMSARLAFDNNKATAPGPGPAFSALALGVHH